MMARDDQMLTVSRPALLGAEGSDAAFRRMLHNLLAFSARLEQVRARFAAFIGLTPPQYTILITVRHLQGGEGVGVRQVADHLALSPAFVTQETGRLVQAGVLNKDPSPDDRRRVLLTVTEHGTELLRRLAPVQREINDQLFDPISGQNFAMLEGLAAELRDSAEKAVRLSDYLIAEGAATQEAR